MKIYFDLDGTIANLYGVENWLDYLMNEDTTPYEIAEPLIDMEQFNIVINDLINYGYEIGIISWLSKNGTKEYNAKVRKAKKEWLNKYCHFKITETHIVKYGTRKDYVAKNKKGILFDDEIFNREHWKGISKDVNDIIQSLISLLDCPFIL